LANEDIFNANMLDDLIANPHLIPEDWAQDEQGRIRYTLFWTEYSDSAGNLFVRALFKSGEEWDWSFICINESIGDNCSVAVRAAA